MTMENHPAEPFTEVLRELAAIKQGLALQSLPAIPLDAFLDMLLDVYNFKLPKRTAQDMIADGRIPIIPKLRAGDQPWVNLVRWRDMAREPEQYFKLVNENTGRRLASSALTKKSTPRSVA